MIDYYANYGMIEQESSLIRKDLDPHKSWKVSVAPTVEPITKEDLKAFARIDGTLEDDLLSSLITTARQLTEDYLGRALITQTIEMYMDFWPALVVELPRPPLISITSVQTLTEAGVATTYSSDNYFTVTNSEPGKLIIKKDVTPPYNTDRAYAGYKITYIAGYGSTAAYIPKAIKDGIKFWATAMYEDRVPSEEPPPMAKIILSNYRIIKL